MAKSRYNIDRLRKKFKEFEEIAKQDIKAVLDSSAQIIVNNAKRNAPANYGKLRQSIGKETKEQGFRQVIFVGEEYAPFLEFGTGPRVEIPIGFQDLASQFIGGKHLKNKGSFDQFLENILQWVLHKKIATPKQAKSVAYLIAMSLLKKGQKARPFLIPAFVDERPKIPEKMDKILQRSAREFNKD